MREYEDRHRVYAKSPSPSFFGAPDRSCYKPHFRGIALPLPRSRQIGTNRKLSNPKTSKSYRFRGSGFRGVRFRDRGFSGSSFIMPALKGCFFTAFLRIFAPGVGPLDERQTLLPVSDLPPPLALPLLAGLRMVKDWTKPWQYGHLVVLTGKDSRRSAAKHTEVVHSFTILFAITWPLQASLLRGRYGQVGSEKRAWVA